jgi:nitroreductase
MDVAETVRRRRAYRVFDPRPIEEEKIRAMIEAMRLAPSCNNNQPWRVVICAGDSLSRVKECLNKGNVWANTAPLIMVVSGKPSDDYRANEGRDYYLFGCGMAVGEMLLQATELGIIAHPIAGFDPVKVRAALGIPIDLVVISLVVCGYPGTDESLLSDKQKVQQRERPERKSIGENFFQDVWGHPRA